MRSIWKKGAVGVALAGLVVAVPSSPQGPTAAHAQSITIDGQSLRSNVAPIKRNGRTLVAMRPIFEGLGAQVQWDSSNKSIVAQTESTSVMMQIGNPMAVVDGRPVMLDQAPLLYLGNTMVPLRFVSEALGAQVNYDSYTNQIGIATTQGGQSTFTPAQPAAQTPSAPTPAAATSGGVSLSLSKKLYAPNEPIELNFRAPTSLSSNAWAAIVPADTPAGRPDLDDSQRLTYQYLGGKTQGKLTYKAPTTAGHYLFRVNHNKTQYASIPFEVQPVTPDATPQIATEKDVFVPGEPIKLHFEAFPFYSSSAWVAIVPSDIPSGSSELNDRNRLTYQYLNGKTQGVLEFKAPSKLGEYDFRLNDNFGHEIALISFSVEPTTPEVTPTISIDRTRYEPGDIIRLRFEAFPFYSSSAWVGMVPAHFDHGSSEINDRNRLTYQYLGGKTQGTLEFKAPSQPGVYDLRLNDGHGNEIATTPPFTVGDGGNDRDRNRGRGGRRNRNTAQTQQTHEEEVVVYEEEPVGGGVAEEVFEEVIEEVERKTGGDSLKDRIRRRIFK